VVSSLRFSFSKFETSWTVHWWCSEGWPATVRSIRRSGCTFERLFIVQSNFSNITSGHLINQFPAKLVLIWLVWFGRHRWEFTCVSTSLKSFSTTNYFRVFEWMLSHNISFDSCLLQIWFFLRIAAS
jgi:hypothetical protein